MSATDQAADVVIEAPTDGAVLNRHDGEAVAGGLKIEVRGRAPEGIVRVNGVEAHRAGQAFAADVVVREFETDLVAECAGARATAKVYWDRHSIPRYRFSIDDNCFFLRDLTLNADRYASLFDHPYLAFWRDMHEQYGARFQFNIYYYDDSDHYDGEWYLRDFPEKYKGEWQDNADWLKLTFHAYANEPRDPYIDAGYDKMAHDYHLVTDEIIRFAGEDTLSAFTTVHWVEATVEGCRALRDAGVKGLFGLFLPVEGGGWRTSYYLTDEQAEYMSRHDYWRDTQEDLWFLTLDIVLNGFPLDQIRPELEQIGADPHRAELMELMIHEQYFWPEFHAHQPDFRQKVETALQWVTERGYRPIFHDEGFLGSPQAQP